MAIAASPALRRPASAVPSITGLRISPPGFKAALVNISSSGLVAEWGLALKIGQAVTVAFEGTVTPQSVGGLVVRSSIASTTSAGLRYHVAVAFTSPIAFEDQAAHATEAETAQASAAASDRVASDDVVNRW
jgi:hypothetical protein